MKDQDREAFEKWKENASATRDEIRKFEAMSEHEKIQHCIELTWQAACEYKQKEINEIELREAKTNRGFVELASKFCSLRTENLKLIECVEFYADTGSWDAVEASDTSVISGVIVDSDIYSPWEEQGISVGGKRAKEVLKELDDK